MNIDLEHGAARLAVESQILAASVMLKHVHANLEHGNIKDAYATCNFDLIKSAMKNLETLAQESP